VATLRYGHDDVRCVRSGFGTAAAGDGGWRASALHSLNEAKGAASLSLILAVALSLAGHGHGREQWLILSGVVIWAALRKTRVF